MRKLYNEYFYIPKGGKIREKVMLARVMSTVVIVVLCLAAMGLTAYAYFSDSLTSGSNKITAANFDIEVEINDEAVSTRDGHKAFIAALKAGEEYQVELTRFGSAKTGFVIVSAEGYDDKYYAVEFDGECLTFTITVDTSTTVSFLPHLGTPSFYDEYKETGIFITNNDTIAFATPVSDEPTAEEPTVSAPVDEKEPPAETSKPAEPVESTTPDPTDPVEAPVPETSEPAESTTPEPSEPTESTAPESSEPADPTEPSESTDMTEPTEPTEPEVPGEDSTEPAEPVTDGSEEIDEPIPEPGE